MIWIALIALAADASADVAPPKDSAVYDVRCARDCRPYFPDAAARAHAGGGAVLQCRAGVDGVLEACEVLGERPEGVNFGVAARIMADRKVIRAVGAPRPGDTILVRVIFERRG